MPLTNLKPQPKDVVIIQRSNDGQSYGEVHISGSNLILYIDSNGYVNADISSSFYSLYPPPANASLLVGGKYSITSSWAETSSIAISASWAPSVGGSGGTTLFSSSTYPITSSWSKTSSVAISASWAPSSGGGGTTLFSSSIYKITSSWAATSSIAISASWAPTTNTATTIFSASVYQITSSWAATSSISFNADTASFLTRNRIYQITASSAISSSWAPTLPADVATSSSWASSSISSSYSSTSSLALLLSTPPSIYSSVSASFNPLTGISTGSCILWLNPNTGSFFDSTGMIPTTAYNSSFVRMCADQSGYGYNIISPNATPATKMGVVYNVGVSGSSTGMYVHNYSSAKAVSATIPTPVKPIWVFCVGKTKGGVQGSVIDGILSTNRMYCTLGAVSQIYSGVSLLGPTTASNDDKWLLWSFKGNGANSSIRINGSPIVSGNSGTQNITGYTLGADYNGAGGGVLFLDLLVYYSITDADAVAIENYLMAKHSLI